MRFRGALDPPSTYAQFDEVSGPLGFLVGILYKSMKLRGPRGPLSSICTGRRSLGAPWAPLRIYVQVDEVSGPLGPHPFFCTGRRDFGAPWTLQQIYVEIDKASGPPVDSLANSCTSR